jgi:hypothetical protein
MLFSSFNAIFVKKGKARRKRGGRVKKMEREMKREREDTKK